jgi:hypothetical protein
MMPLDSGFAPNGAPRNDEACSPHEAKRNAGQVLREFRISLRFIRATVAPSASPIQFSNSGRASSPVFFAAPGTPYL